VPSKAPFSKRFENAVGESCESAAARRVAKQFGLAASTVRPIDLRYLERWAAGRHKPALRQMRVDEIHMDFWRTSATSEDWHAQWEPTDKAALGSVSESPGRNK